MALDGERIQVQERVYKRILNTPKNGKTREGAISDGTLSLLKEWAELAEEPSAEGFVFPSEKLVPPSPSTISGGDLCSRSWRRSGSNGRRFRC